MNAQIRVSLSWAPVLLMSLLLSGCTSLHVSRTVSASGLAPLADASHVTVIEKKEDVAKPYQIVGKVTVYRTGTRITKGSTTTRICESAAQVGADGVIDLHPNFGKGLYSALLVKWLAPGEVVKAKESPFMVALLPITAGANTPANRSEISNFVQQRLVYLMDAKGYYLMPDMVSDFVGGIDAAMKLDDAALQALGGKDADLIMEVAVIDAKSKLEWGLFGATKEGKAVVRTTIMSKATRKIIFQKEATGAASIGGAEKWSRVTSAGNAAFAGAEEALADLKTIHDSSSF